MSLKLGSQSRRFTCYVCQWQRFMSVSSRRLAAEKQPPAAPGAPEAATKVPGSLSQDLPAAAINAPRSYGRRVEKFTPEIIPRPIGMHKPPHPNDNTGIDPRTLQQRRDDFVNYEKHLARRKQLKEQIARPYFRDWSNLQFDKGKSFLAPPRPFRSDVSLFFPNFVGDTLLKGNKGNFRDTTNVLHGKTSVVAMYNGKWAEDQAGTFISKAHNPALHELMAANADALQIVQLNLEDNSAKAWLVRLFAGSLRRQVGEANWGKYFIVKSKVSDEIRESIGLLNSKVGYVYLVDHLCRIRWAASANSRPDERESLVKSAKIVLDEYEKDLKDIRAIRSLNKERPRG